MKTSTETLCEQAFRQNCPYWHICTPGDRTGLIFPRDEDYHFGMTLTAICHILVPEIRLLTFELMSNHVHFLVTGDKNNAKEFFDIFKKKLMRYYSEKSLKLDFSHFDCSLIPVDSLKSIRNEIVYINRNGYVVNPSFTPFSYPWGAGRHYFNPILHTAKYGDLLLKEKREICRSRNLCIPDNYLIYENYISPVSSCDIELGMSMFKDAHQYFACITKNVEAYSEIADRLNDRAYLTDDELFSIAFKICRSSFQGCSPAALNRADKIEVAKTLHYDYKASNNQIRRILSMAQHEIDSLFPLSKK